MHATPRIQVMDGGMGTLLEAKGYDVSGPMWGSELVQSRPAVISEIHESYFRSGSDIVQTATYQMTPKALEQCAPGQGNTVMSSAVGLATAAAERHAGAVALSLGSFGSTLKPGQEYAGVYPPPFGPDLNANSTSSDFYVGTGSPQQDVSEFDSESERQCENALYAFHLERLRAYQAATTRGFAGMAWLAFETVPNLAEIRAIRRAMATLRIEGRPDAGSSRDEEWAKHAERHREASKECSTGAEGADARGRDESSELYAEAAGGAADTSGGVCNPHEDAKSAPLHAQSGQTPRHGVPHDSALPRFWVSSAFPSGQLGSAPNGPHTVAEWVSAMLDGGEEYASPDGFGVNCTNPSHLPAILDEIEARVPAKVRAATALVVYPDGGCVYDTLTKTWTEKTGSPDDWARGILDVLQGRSWQEIIVGGCCKTGPEEIAALRKVIG